MKVMDRFAAKTVLEPPTVRWFWTGDQYEELTVECLAWTGAKNANGYGRFWPTRDECWTAHRFAYTTTYGKIPDGHEVDHLCRNQQCVEPSHLESVTAAENHRRRQIIYLILNPTCPQGHAWTDDNTGLYSNGSRRCNQCNRDHVRAWRKKQPRKPRVLTPTCARGHDRSVHSYVSPKGRRYCRICAADAVDRYRARKPRGLVP